MTSRYPRGVSGDDPRAPFDEALVSFRATLRRMDWSDELLWLARDRVRCDRRTLWVLRPAELRSSTASRGFYEAARATDHSLRIDALGALRGATVAVVIDWGGESRMLNFGVPLPDSRYAIRSITRRSTWALLGAYLRARGGAAMLDGMAIPGRAL